MKKLPSKTELIKLLSHSVFDPRESGPMSVVVSMNSPDYCEAKAVELILEARNENKHDKHDAKIIQAISLLALARSLRIERPKKKKTNDHDNHDGKPII